MWANRAFVSRVSVTPARYCVHMFPAPDINQILEDSRLVAALIQSQTDMLWARMWHDYPLLMVAVALISLWKTVRWVRRSLGLGDR